MRTPTAKVKLTKGLVAIIDAADLELVSQYKWYAMLSDGRHYAATRLKGERNLLLMHRLLTGAPAGRNIRFNNRNSLDLRRKNLFVTPTPKAVA